MGLLASLSFCSCFCFFSYCSDLLSLSSVVIGYKSYMSKPYLIHLHPSFSNSNITASVDVAMVNAIDATLDTDLDSVVQCLDGAFDSEPGTLPSSLLS